VRSIGAEGDGEMSSAEAYRRNADDCRQRSLQARSPEAKANWLKIAEEWQRLAEEVDADTPASGLKAKGK
jgi:hypothetical protein